MKRWFFLTGALATALVVRVWAAGQIFTSEGTFPSGTDAYYHLRRVWLALTHGFAIPHRDLFCHFPDGVVDPWPPLHDLAVAVLAWLAGGGAPSPETVARVACVVPLVLGMVSVVLVYALGRRLVGSSAALFGAWIYAALPAAAYRFQVGMADHHAAEIVFALAIYTFVAREARGRGRSVWMAVAFGLTLGAACLTWLGAVLFVGLAFGFLLARMVCHIGQAGGRATARFTALAFGLASLVVAPFALTTEAGRAAAWRVYHLSLLQPGLLLALGGLAGLLFLGQPWCRRGERPRVRALGLVAAAALAAGLIALLTPVGAGFREGLAFARQPVPALLLPVESQPLFFPRGAFSLHYAWWLFASAGPAALIGGWLLLWRHPRGSHRPDRGEARWLLWWLVGVHLVLACLQLRFTSYLAAEAVLLAGVVGARLCVWAGPRGGTLLAGVLLVLPGGVIWFTRFGPAPPDPELRRALVRLEQTSPPVDQDRPEYGVAAVWDLGHHVNWLARRPCLDSPFLHLTPFRTTAAMFLAGTEKALNALADANRVRYVVSVPITRSPWGPDNPGDDRYLYLYPRQFIHVLNRRESDYLEPRKTGLGITPWFAWTMLFRLHFLNGVRPRDGHDGRFPGLGPEMFAAPTLRTWRLHAVAEPDKQQGPGEGNRRFKIFEHVAGARLEGQLVPGAVIEVGAMVALSPSAWDRFEYHDQVQADFQGRFNLRVPYWSRTSEDQIGVVKGFVLTARSLDWHRVVKVTESDVREGKTVIVP